MPSHFHRFIHSTFIFVNLMLQEGVYTLWVRKYICCFRHKGFGNLCNSHQWLKSARPLNQWRRLRGKAPHAAWSRLLEISVLHLKVALPQCCVSVSNLMLLIKKIPTWSKQWFPHQVSLRGILLTYMCRFLFCGTCLTKQEVHQRYIMHAACHMS